MSRRRRQRQRRMAYINFAIIALLIAGGVAAFLGFTLPSFLIMVMVALYATRLPEAWLNGLVSGLKWLAVVVVAVIIVVVVAEAAGSSAKPSRRA